MPRKERDSKDRERKGGRETESERERERERERESVCGFLKRKKFLNNDIILRQKDSHIFDVNDLFYVL